MSSSTSPLFSGCPWIFPIGSMRFGCCPAVIQAAISSWGEPSEVTSPLKSLMATCFSFSDSVELLSVPFEIMPDAPSPNVWCTEREDQVMSSKMGLSSKLGAHGFPAKERNESSGSSKSQAGRRVSLLADRRKRPSFRQWDISFGRDARLFPANMHFCNR